MTNLADSGPAAGGTALAVLYALGHIVVAISKWLKERDRKRAMEAVPATEQRPPGPAVDAAVLARLERAEQHDALTTALLQERWHVSEREREIGELRRALAERTLALELEQAGHAIAREQVRARDDLVARLRAELDRARRRRGAVEPPAPEHRDASQAGPIQDVLRTPLRPKPRG